MRPIVIGTLMEFYSTGQPVVLDEKDVPSDTSASENDSEVPTALTFFRQISPQAFIVSCNDQGAH